MIVSTFRVALDKGRATYFLINEGDENAVWSHEAPYSAIEMLPAHPALQPNKVDSIEIAP